MEWYGLFVAKIQNINKNRDKELTGFSDFACLRFRGEVRRKAELGVGGEDG